MPSSDSSIIGTIARFSAHFARLPAAWKCNRLRRLRTTSAQFGWFISRIDMTNAAPMNEQPVTGWHRLQEVHDDPREAI